MRPVPCFLFLCTSAGALGWYAGAPPHSDQPPPRTEAAASGVAQIVRPATPAVKISTLSAAAVKARLEAVLASPARDSVELRLLLAQWVATDLEAARQWMREIPDDLHDRQSRAAVMEFFKAWTRLDPDAALEEAKTLRLLKRNESLSSIVPTLAEADLATIHRVLGKLPPDSPGPFNSIGITDLVRRLAACDPAGAQTIPALLSPVRAAAAVSVLAEVMARSDPQAALAWVQQQPDATARKAAEDAVFKEWARRDPAAVGPLLLQKTEGRPDVFRADAAVAALRRLSDGSAAEATAFVEKFIPPDQVNAHLRSFFDVLGKNPESPGGAAALCACVAKLSPEALKEAKLFPSSWLVYEGMKPAWDRMMAEPDSPARTFLLGQMGQKLMDQRPAEVIQEVMKLPDPAGREELLAAVFSGRRGFDGTGTDDYRGGLTELRAVVESLPEGLRDQGAMRLAWATAGDDPRGGDRTTIPGHRRR